MPVATESAAVQAVRAKYVDVAVKHNEHLDDIERLRQAAIEEVVPTVLREVGLEDDAQAEKHTRSYLKDKALLFRFYRRARYTESTALDMLTATLTWRLRTDLDSLSLASLHPAYTSPAGRPPLFWCNTQCADRYGRPLGVISLQSLERVVNDEGQGGLEECREYIVGCMESVRRYLAVQYAQAAARAKTHKIDVDKIQAFVSGSADKVDYRPPPLQMVIVISLASSGMANLELELLPFLLDLLKNHFPSMVGAVYILHFGWVHSGMWALAKRVLPQQALAKIFFPNNKELAEHFDLDKVPVTLGGHNSIELVNETNDVMQKFARPLWNARLSRSASRTDLTNKADHKGHLESGKNGEDVAEGDVEDVEASSAPPSPRGQSGTSTPMHGHARTPRSLSRVGSFDSLIDEFHSVANSPILSRSATPRPSRPTTPHAELSGFHFTSATHSPHMSSQLRLTPSAVHKLQHLQMSRGAQGGGTRSRTSSDAALLSDPAVRRSPAVSRGVSPEREKRLRSATSSQVTLGGAAKARNSVRFDPGPSQNMLGISNHYGAFPGPTIEEGGKPIKRVGSLRDFRLHLDDLAQPDAGIEGTDESGSSQDDRESEDEDGALSDRSGKATERTDEREGNQDQPSRATRFFSLLRRRRSTTEPGLGPKAAQGISASTSDLKAPEDDVHGLPASDTLISLAPEPIALPDSPQLQVPDIEEPPLSELTPLFSRRAKLHDLPGHVSPYNSANPFYGYPAYPAAGAGHAMRGPSNDPRRRYHFRRRKRDLVRTLIYLFVLRLLALHRHVRTGLLIVYRQTLRTVTLGNVEPMQGNGTEVDEQYQQYQRLRNAGSRFSTETISGSDSGRSKSSRGRPANAKRQSSFDVLGQTTSMQKPKPQPLVALGFRKRYALLAIIIAFTLLRREWQMRRRR